MKELKVGDKVLVPMEIISKRDGGDFPYTIGYDTARINMSEKRMAELQTLAHVDKTYEDGLMESWDMAKKMFLYPHEGGYRSEELEEIFGRTEHLWELTPQEAITKIAEWEDEKKIRVGDLIRAESGHVGVVTNVHKGDCYILWADGSSGCRSKEGLTNTGRTIDIAGLLTQIGGADDE